MTYLRSDLEKMKVSELRNILKDDYEARLAKMKKKELIKVILEEFKNDEDTIFNFKHYNEDTDTDSILNISSDFIDEIEAHGYILLNKIGQGGGIAAFSATDKDNNMVAVLIDGASCKYIKPKISIRSLQKKNILDINDMMEIYKILTIKSRLSKDPLYCPNNDTFISRVQVVEILDQTIAEKTLEIVNVKYNEKKKFLVHTIIRVDNIMEKLNNSGYCYTDIELDNFGINNNGVIKLIDLESIKKSNENCLWTKLRKSFIYNLLDEHASDLDEFALKMKSVKGIYGISSNESEKKKLIKYLKSIDLL